MITIATVLNHRPPHEGHGFSRATGENPRPILKPSFSAASEVGGWQEIKVNSGELNHREGYLYLRCRKLAPLLKQRTYQPEGWPTLIFENSIVGLSSPATRMKRGSGRPSAPLLCARRGQWKALFARPLTGQKRLRNRLSALVRNF